MLAAAVGFESPLPRQRERDRERVLASRQMLANAKRLRTSQTEAELRLWYQLRAHRFLGFKFKRQKPIGKYIVDFVCMEAGLVIELDGSQHADNEAYDAARDQWLSDEVLRNTDGVLEQIRLALSPASGRGE